MAFDISESSRNVFAKNEQFPVELDDKRLLNALARFDKTDDSKPELDDALNFQGNRARPSKGARGRKRVRSTS